MQSTPVIEPNMGGEEKKGAKRSRDSPLFNEKDPKEPRERCDLTVDEVYGDLTSSPESVIAVDPETGEPLDNG